MSRDGSSFVEEFLGEMAGTSLPPHGTGLPPEEDEAAIEDPSGKEIVVQSNGQARQAGSDLAEGTFVKLFKKRAESSLFIFAKGVLRKFWLYPPLHLPVCNWLQGKDKRLLLLMPREHSKTAIISHSLPIHIHIQSKEENLYFPGRDGSSIRILLAGETASKAQDNLQVIRLHYESNELLRALWPERVWENARRESPAWNNEKIILPREEIFADPSIRTSGIGVAITGSRTDAQIKDDLTTFDAANSPTIMNAAIEWHRASGALQQSRGGSREWLLGTHWATFDLYTWIMAQEPDVKTLVRSIVEDGKIILPVDHDWEGIERMKKKYGPLYQLMYMNNPFDPELTDFAESDLREYTVNEGGKFTLGEDHRDALLADRLNAPPPPPPDLTGTRLSQVRDELFGQGKDEFLRLRYG